MKRVHSAQENENQFDRQFREGVRNGTVTPPDGLWDRVSYSLDEERAKAKYDHWYYALLILLVPLTIAQILVSDEFAKYYPADADNSRNWQTYSGDAGTYSSELLAAKEAMIGPHKYNTFYGNRKSESKEQDEISGPVNSIPLYGIKAIKSKNSAINIKAEKTFGHPNEYSLALSPVPGKAQPGNTQSFIDESLQSVKGFHFGFGGGISNSWLIDKSGDLYNNLGAEYDVQQKFDIGPHYGLSVGYDFSEKYGVEVEWVIKAMQGQKFVENRYNKLPVNGEIDLHYMHLPVMFKYKFSKVSNNNFQPRVLNLIAGLQYSRLRDATVAFEDLEVLNANDLFNRNQLGFIMGVEYDLFLNKNYFFTFGARSTFTTDVTDYPSSVGNEGYYSNGKKGVYNVLFGVHTSINYMMRNKNRKSK